MDRLACVDLPAFALQIALRARPQWKNRPVALLDRNEPTGAILQRNVHARRAGVELGMRYSAGLALCGDLRACSVAPHELDDAVEATLVLLRRFSPAVEPARDEPGTFWLALSGLERLYPSLESWGQTVREALQAAHWNCAVVVGWRRFESFALARAARGSNTVVVTADAEAERRSALKVALAHFLRHPRALRHFRLLAVRTLADFVALHTGEILVRYGPEVAHLHRLASGKLAPPLEPVLPREPLAAERDLDMALEDRGGLVALLEELVQPLFERLAARGQAAQELELALELERAAPLGLRIRAAQPTLEWKRWARLFDLHLERVSLAGGATRVAVLAHGNVLPPEQTSLFAERPRRDPRAAGELFAQLRAAFGEDVVARARLCSRHLPEASFAWERLELAPRARPRAIEPRRLVRRSFAPVRALPARERREDGGWLVRGLEHGPAISVSGPYRASGGWWRNEVRRDYYFVELERGQIVWIYHDDVRRHWCWQGSVA